MLPYCHLAKKKKKKGQKYQKVKLLVKLLKPKWSRVLPITYINCIYKHLYIAKPFYKNDFCRIRTACFSGHLRGSFTPTPSDRHTPSLGRHVSDRHPMARYPLPKCMLGYTPPAPLYGGIHTPCEQND